MLSNKVELLMELRRGRSEMESIRAAVSASRTALTHVAGQNDVISTQNKMILFRQQLIMTKLEIDPATDATAEQLQRLRLALESPGNQVGGSVAVHE